MKTRNIIRLLCWVLAVLIIIQLIIIGLTISAAIDHNTKALAKQERIEALKAEIDRKDRGWAAAANQLTRCQESQPQMIMRPK